MPQNLKYPNLVIFFSIVFMTILFFYNGALQGWIEELEGLGYVGVILAGMFFVSTFTVLPAAAVLTFLSKDLDVAAMSLFAGLGAMIGDYLIFRFVKDDLAKELKLIFRQVGGNNIFKFHRIIHTKYFAWLGPVIGALIIASPLPDELGVGLLGIYQVENKKFILLSYIMNTIGIFLLLSVAKAVVVN